MHAYCDRQGHPENSVIFLYDGELWTAFVLLSALASLSWVYRRANFHWLM